MSRAEQFEKLSKPIEGQSSILSDRNGKSFSVGDKVEYTTNEVEYDS
ncbi:MAG TPA: hypothetical protein PKG96_05395 [Bacilli bacterium]|nr:hypothetical protein [Bacilli bacterium]